MHAHEQDTEKQKTAPHFPLVNLTQWMAMEKDYNKEMQPTGQRLEEFSLVFTITTLLK